MRTQISMAAGPPQAGPSAETRATGIVRLRCPRCDLTLGLRVRWLAIEHCPRCVARARTLVELVPTDRPAAE